LAKSVAAKATTNAYVQPGTCAACHADIAASYANTAMAHSFCRTSAENTVEDDRLRLVERLGVHQKDHAGLILAEPELLDLVFKIKFKCVRNFFPHNLLHLFVRDRLGEWTIISNRSLLNAPSVFPSTERVVAKPDL
jgi:hypothetical protein